MNVTRDKIIYIESDIQILKEKAFEIFVNQFNNWWPQEYTWSGSVLKSIGIEPKINGKCYEIGSYDFRYDWGRVLKINPPDIIKFTWQISPERVPEPDPNKSSEIEIEFTSGEDASSKIKFKHKKLSNHGEGWLKYYEALNSEMGWPFILKKFKTFCEA